MRTLIFDESLSGHHLEYLHHYYRGAVDRPEEEFVFCIDGSFKQQKELYCWPETKNVRFEYLSSIELDAINHEVGIKQRVMLSRLLARKAKELQADKVLLSNFTHMMPFMCFFMPKGIKVRGIIYRIYLHTKERVSKLRYVADTLMFWLMAKNDTMDRVFILNDKTSACQLNHNFRTSKFTYLPDPVPEIEELKLSNLRSIYNIPDKNKVYLHFGGLTYRKGTLEILKAINILDNNLLKDKSFIFAGRVYKEMHDEFYQLLELAKEKVQILVFDAFCEYDFLYNLCYTCDAILMPYQQNEMSSGVLGYAAVFNKPVIGPDGGLIGNIIKKYHLGCCLPTVNKDSIAQSLTQDICCDSSSYVKDNDVNSFINTLLD